MNENYIVINGKKIELTEEQLKQLGIEVKKENPYQSDNAIHAFMNDDGRIEFEASMYVEPCKTIFQSFATRELAEQTYSRELLERKLRAYAYDHNSEQIDYKCRKIKSVILYDHDLERFTITRCNGWNFGIASFTSDKIAENAIKEVIEPFMKEHPNFKWGE